MKFNKFQRLAAEIVEYNATEAAFWVAEEAGEVAKAFKTPPPSPDYLFEELGDVLIAVASLSSKSGFSFDDIAEAAIKKWQKKMAKKAQSQSTQTGT